MLQTFTPNCPTKYAPMLVEALQVGDPLRAQANRFISSGFKKAYGADINVSMPLVIALHKNSMKAALGVRLAYEALFVEQYMPLPIELMLKKSTTRIIGSSAYLANSSLVDTTARSSIAEIGHLYSNASNFTLSLLIVTALFLRKQGVKIMVFTATSALESLFIKFGLAPQFIVKANPDRLKSTKQCWGTYYDTEPKVMALALDDVQELIDNNRLFSVMAAQLMPQIQNLLARSKVAA